jgi:hypothetical protein
LYLNSPQRAKEDINKKKKKIPDLLMVNKPPVQGTTRPPAQWREMGK